MSAAARAGGMESRGETPPRAQVRQACHSDAAAAKNLTESFISGDYSANLGA